MRSFRPAALCLQIQLAALLAAAASAADPEEKAWEAVVRADFGEAARIHLGLLREDPAGPLAEYHLLRVQENASRAGPAGAPAAKEALELARGSGSPSAKARAEWARAESLLRRGDTAGAEAVARGLGLVREWALIGPFENENEAGFDEAFGPEADVAARSGFADLSAAHEGKQGPCRWLLAPALHPMGAVDLSRLFRLGED
ncbi:MAG: hypothetical protein MUC63_09270, partial [Planctomycetes bacterium]|nr:hypothetical protein [Planctomycetota bacterium]